MVNKLLRDVAGSVLVEFTVVFPLFIVLMLGTVDIAYMLFEWNTANKAAYIGARAAVVSDVVAQTSGGKSIADLSNFGYSTDEMDVLGESCVDSASGSPQVTGAGNNYCKVFTAVSCTGSAIAATVVTCSNNQTPNKTAFSNGSTGIFDKMSLLYPGLQRQNVQIIYVPNGLGFVGGQTFNVTVSIQGMTHQFFFIDTVIKFLSGVVPAIASAPQIPTYSTTLQGEDMLSSNN